MNFLEFGKTTGSFSSKVANPSKLKISDPSEFFWWSIHEDLFFQILRFSKSLFRAWFWRNAHVYEHLWSQKLIISWKCYAWPFGTYWWIIIKYSENVTFHCKEIGLFLVSGGIWSLFNSGHPFLVRSHVICFGGPRGVWWTRTRHRNVLLRIPQVRTKYCDVAFSRHPLRYLALCINCDERAQKSWQRSRITFT